MHNAATHTEKYQLGVYTQTILTNCCIQNPVLQFAIFLYNSERTRLFIFSFIWEANRKRARDVALLFLYL